MLFAQIQILGIRRDIERFFFEAEERFVH
jgi:hypothetical protein